MYSVEDAAGNIIGSIEFHGTFWKAYDRRDNCLGNFDDSNCAEHAVHDAA